MRLLSGGHFASVIAKEIKIVILSKTKDPAVENKE